MNPAELAEIKARYVRGESTEQDFRTLLSFAASAPTTEELLRSLAAGEQEFNRLIGQPA